MFLEVRFRPINARVDRVPSYVADRVNTTRGIGQVLAIDSLICGFACAFRDAMTPELHYAPFPNISASTVDIAAGFIAAAAGLAVALGAKAIFMPRTSR